MQGTKNKCVIVKTGTKEGTCVVKAKTEKKTYIWKIKVKKDKKNSKATLVKVKQTDTELDVTIKLSNRSKKWKEYGQDYSIERIENGCWKKIKLKDDVYEYEVEDVAYSIPVKGSVKETYQLTTCYNREDFTKGIYRITVDADFDKKSYSKVIFEVK